MSIFESSFGKAGDHVYGRIQLIFFIALLYLAQGVFNNWVFPLFESPAKTAYLKTISPNQLGIETSSMHGREEGGNVLQPAHAPFFFQAISVNRADKEMLLTVKGIGPTLADSIISYRQAFGPFKRSEDLTRIPGVGPKRAASLAPFLLFEEVP